MKDNLNSLGMEDIINFYGKPKNDFIFCYIEDHLNILEDHLNCNANVRQPQFLWEMKDDLNVLQKKNYHKFLKVQ